MIEVTTRNYTWCIDDEDYSLFNSRNWGAHNTGSNIYLTYLENKTRRRYFHREVMQATATDIVDHINGDTFNCCKSNLRNTTHSVNKHNTGKLTTNTSGYKGVSKRARAKPWMAKININCKQIYLGQYSTAIEAAKAYDMAAFTHFGFSQALNFPQDFK